MADQRTWTSAAQHDNVLDFRGFKDLYQNAGKDRGDALLSPAGKVLGNAIANTIYFVIGTLAIIQISSVSRSLGLALFGIGALLVLFQFFKVLLILVGDLVVFLLALSGMRRHEDDETEMLWASHIRVVEFGIWMGCVFILYRFFYP
jgi:hypothetical protein